jgi:signal transduction histidine kinase
VTYLLLTKPVWALFGLNFCLSPAKGVGEGTGLGLHIAYRIVVVYDEGDISLVSKPGCTRFQVRLPIEQSARRNS